MILEKTGFDSQFALSDITSKELQEIESTVNSDKKILATLKSYQDIHEFILKPGHKALLINLSGKIENHLNIKQQEKVKK